MFDAHNTQLALNHVANAGLVVDGELGPATLAALLRHASQRPLSQLALVPAIAAAMATGLEVDDINTPLRLRHFLAQTACETAGFTRLVESDGGDPNYFKRYEGNRNLGNTLPGDGAKFKGRGLLDTTGRWNYGELAKLTGLDCVVHPELLEEPENAMLAAGCFWVERKCNEAADASDIKLVTIRVNGGTNGLADRMTYFGRLGVIQA